MPVSLTQPINKGNVNLWECRVSLTYTPLTLAEHASTFWRVRFASVGRRPGNPSAE